MIRLKRNNVKKLDCNEILFFKVVKTAFNQRRKMLRNGLREMLSEEIIANPIFDKRAEQLGVKEFVFITQEIERTNPGLIPAEK